MSIMDEKFREGGPTIRESVDSLGRGEAIEPYPVETFQGFTDSDLEQLLVDTTKELARRQGGSWFRLGPLSDGQYGGPRRYQT